MTISCISTYFYRIEIMMMLINKLNDLFSTESPSSNEFTVQTVLLGYFGLVSVKTRSTFF